MHKTETFEGFTPTTDTSRAFRNVLGCFGTGITVVTCTGPQGPLGITANSFSAVSLDPPLVLWCPAHSSSRFETFAKAKHYTIHVLAEDQYDLGVAFAKNGQSFDHCQWDSNEWGAPVIHGTLARFECRAHDLHTAGDHAIAVGHVQRAHARKGRPLLFVQGQYGHFKPTA